MTQDDINKIETLVGYLQPLYDDLDIQKKLFGGWGFMPGFIEEAEAYLADIKQKVSV